MSDDQNNPKAMHELKTNEPTGTAVRSTDLLACPWCDSEKVMAEGTDTRVYLVCQKCLARGPEVTVAEGRDGAIREWNKALRQPRKETRYVCERCGMTVALVHYMWSGIHRWRHVGGKTKLKSCGLPPKVRQANK